MILQIGIWFSVLLVGIFPEEQVRENPLPALIEVEELLAKEPLPAEEELSPEAASLLMYDELELNGIIAQEAFVAAYTSMMRYSKSEKNTLAIADMQLPSTEKRLYLIDIKSKRFISRTWVAHGTNTGELYAKKFSNKEGSHQSSKGLYEIGHRIISPKHGPALLLYGLEKGLNDRAEEREIIMHKADYVSSEFIRENGHLGRSWGCPAVSEDAMPLMLKYLTNDGLLFIHA